MGETFGIRVMTTAAEAPFSNGLCERLNSVLGRNVKKIMEDSGCSVEEALAWAVSARNCLSNFTGFSPNQLVFGKNPCLPNVMGDDLPALEETGIGTVSRNLSAIHSARSEFLKLESSEKIRRALRHNVRATETQFLQLGDHVFYKRDSSDKWHGPAVVVGVDGKQVFVKHAGAYIRVHLCRLQRTPVENEDARSNESENTAVNENNPSGNSNGVLVEEDSDEAAEVEEPVVNQEEVVNGESDSENGGEDHEQGVILGETRDRLRFKPGDRFEAKDRNTGEVYAGKIVTRAGKVGGKYENCFNFRKDTDNSVSCADFYKDFSEVRSIPDSEETLVAVNSDAVWTAKCEEMESWKRNNVFEEVMYENQKTISVRWVVTEKVKNGNFVVKARLAARGFEEDTSGIRKDSPTCSKESVRIAVTLASARDWKISSLDVKSAYLQGNEIDREIFLKPPPEFENYQKVWKLKKTVYGLNDAARAWFLRVKSELDLMGVEISLIDPALFSWKVNGSLEGIICVYVDDFLWAGTERFGEIISRIKKHL